MTIVATNRNSCNNPTGLDPTQPNPSITPPAPPPRLSQAPQLRSSRHARTSRSRGRAHPDPDRARRRLRLHRSASGREMRGSSRRPVAVVMAWVRRQPPKVKAFLAVVAGMAALVFIRFIVHDHDNLFVAAEAAHALGIAVLIYKLTKEKTCAGPSPRFRHPFVLTLLLYNCIPAALSARSVGLADLRSRLLKPCVFLLSSRLL
jgi:hypothetical protein